MMSIATPSGLRMHGVYILTVAGEGEESSGERWRRGRERKGEEEVIIKICGCTKLGA